MLQGIDSNKIKELDLLTAEIDMVRKLVVANAKVLDYTSRHDDTDDLLNSLVFMMININEKLANSIGSDALNKPVTFSNDPHLNQNSFLSLIDLDKVFEQETNEDQNDLNNMN